MLKSQIFLLHVYMGVLEREFFCQSLHFLFSGCGNMLHKESWNCLFCNCWKSIHKIHIPNNHDCVGIVLYMQFYGILYMEINSYNKRKNVSHRLDADDNKDKRVSRECSSVKILFFSSIFSLITRFVDRVLPFFAKFIIYYNFHKWVININRSIWWILQKIWNFFKQKKTFYK